jgi:hypothetical protein
MLNDQLGIVALALLYVLSMLGWGSLFLRLFPKSSGSFWNELAAQLIGGMAVSYATFIGLGVAGHLHRIPVGVVIGLGVLACCAGLPSLIRKAADFLSQSEPWNTTDLALLILVSALTLLQIVMGLTPLVFYDLQAYHLLAPAQFLRSGSLAQIPWNFWTDTPMALQLTVGMSLLVDSTGQVAKLLFTLVGCLLSIGTYELLRSAGRRAALLGTLFVLCFPEFWVIQTFGIPDLAIAAFVVFGTIWTAHALRDGSWRSTVLAGFAFGFAIGSKYQAVILTAWMLVAILAEASLRESRFLAPRRILRICAIGLLATLIVLPWLVRNYVHHGNPVFPLMAGVWSTTEWSGEQAQRVNAETLGPSLRELSPTQRILAPVGALLVSPSNGLFGTALLLGALLALTVNNRDLQLVAILGLGGLVVWGLIRPAAGFPLVRFNAASIVLLLAATGAVLGSELIPRGAAIASVLGIVSFVIAMVHLHTIIPAVPSLVDPPLRLALQQVNIPSSAAFAYINERLDPSHDKVLLIGETRGFWLNVPFLGASPFNGPQLLEIFGTAPDPAYWQARLEEIGITHLLVSDSELRRLREKYDYLRLLPGQIDAFNHWIETLPQAFDDGQGTAVLVLPAAGQGAEGWRSQGQAPR